MTDYAKIVDIPDHLIDEVEATVTSEEQRPLVESLVRFMTWVNDKGINAMLQEFPCLVAAVDNPTPTMKANLDEYTLKFANNLTKEEARIIINTHELSDISGMIDHNHDMIASEMSVEHAIEMLHEFDDLSLFDNYKDYDWYKSMLEIYNLENI